MSSTSAMSRRSLMGAALASGASALVAGPAIAAEAAPSPSTSGKLPPAPQAVPSRSITDAGVRHALAGLTASIHETMTRTGIPGVAVAVVYDDKVEYIESFGVRKAGSTGAVNVNTIFQLASVSKPIASTVISGLVGDGVVGWDDPIVKHLRSFTLKDPWVGSHATIADGFSHRTGLPGHAGDLLEDLGYDRNYILAHLKHEPLDAFRASYAYTNFGLTAGAEAAASAAGKAWDVLSHDRLYRPAGMTSTSSRFADFIGAANHASTHVKVGSQWVAKYVRDPDAQSPAGGVSSSIHDVARWLRLQLAAGVLDGTRIIKESPLAETRVPHSISNPPSVPDARASFYGLGLNVGYDTFGRVSLNHSGAFALGAATYVAILPTEKLAIAVLTNAAPIGAAETIGVRFMDVAQNGHETVDWALFLTKVFAAMADEGRSPIDYSKPPAGAKPARHNSAYVGTFGNDYYGPMTVATSGSHLTMALGPKPITFPLAHYDGDVFSYQTIGENAVGLSGVTFTVSGGHAGSVRVENLDHTGLGTFKRN